MEVLDYEDILLRMKNKFKEECGLEADDASDIGIRLKILAGELYEITNSLKFLENQMFPQTASKEYLEKYAQERGVIRKPATKAQGYLYFSRNFPESYNVQIPMGTVCSIGDSSGYSYVTTEDALIYSERTGVLIKAEAVLEGRVYNCSANVVGSIVTSVVGVDGVYNPEAFVGGQNEESDESLRKRLEESYKILPNGANSQYYKSYIEKNFDEVSSLGVKPMENGVGTVGIYLWGRGTGLNEDLINRVSESLEEIRDINTVVSVSNATPYYKTSYIYISPKEGCDFETARVKTLAAVENFYSNLSVGDPVYKADLGRFIMENAPIKNYTIPSGTLDFSGDPSLIPVLSSSVVVPL